MSAAPYIHPEFRFISPKQRFRRRLCVALASLAVAGIGAALMVPSGARNSDAAVAPMDQLSSVLTIPTVSPAGNGAVDQRPARGSVAQAVAQKRVCLGPSGPDGSCVPFQPPKVRMVRVGTPGPLMSGRRATPQRRLRPRRRPNSPKGSGRQTNRRHRRIIRTNVAAAQPPGVKPGSPVGQHAVHLANMVARASRAISGERLPLKSFLRRRG